MKEEEEGLFIRINIIISSILTKFKNVPAALISLYNVLVGKFFAVKEDNRLQDPSLSDGIIL